MEVIQDLVNNLSSFVWNFPENLGLPVPPILVLLLLGTGLFFAIRLGFIQVRKLKHSYNSIRGKYDNPEDEGDINHFQALTSALSATIGIGNIAGVATAIHYGGPGALFWMWVTAIFGMGLKYVECTLSHHYREIHEDGSASGGPMYYIEKGLGSKWKWLAVTFAILTVISSFGTGNSIQSFTMADQLKTDLGIPTIITGLVSAFIVGLVIIGGIRRIGRVTSKLVPIMAVIYVIGGLLILILHFDRVPQAFITIFEEAFTPTAGIGGFAGSTWLFMMIWGVKRGLFSNESGQGSAPIAHAAAKTKESAREGVVAMVGPFIDTLIICTITGLVIVTTGVWFDKKPLSTYAFTAQEDITIIHKEKDVYENGKVPDDIKYFGTFNIENGKTNDVAFVKNHSLVEGFQTIENRFEYRKGSLPLITHNYNSIDDYKLFSGKGIIDDDGVLTFITIDGKKLDGYEVRLIGSAMQNGSPLTAWAFDVGLEQLIGNLGHYIITIGVFLFAISTAIAWSYYGDRSLVYLIGRKAILPYHIIYCIIFFIGAIISLEAVWGFGDIALGLMAIPNLIGILALSNKAAALTKDYFKRHRGK